eukprot:1158328-Pelagomonas_calceolata.AAC.8
MVINVCSGQTGHGPYSLLSEGGAKKKPSGKALDYYEQCLAVNDNAAESAWKEPCQTLQGFTRFYKLSHQSKSATARLLM